MMRRRRSLAIGALAGAAVMGIAAGCAGDSPGERASATSAGSGTAGQAASRSVRMAQRCDAPDASVLIDSAGIGPVLLATRVPSLRRRCAVVDTTLTLGEGMMERAHEITVAGREVIALSTGTPDTSIIRVITVDPVFRTSGGVGVGSSVESLRLAHGSLCAAQGEGNFIVTVTSVPGVSFAIDWSPPPSREPSVAETPFPGGDPGNALDATRITRIWVHGVTGGCRVGVG